MERHRTHFPGIRSKAGIALAAVGILVLLENVDCTFAQLKNGFCATMCDALGIWPCILFAARQAAQACVLDHHGLLGWLLHLLLALWKVLPLAGATI